MEQVLAEPLHPYTRLLLAAVPDPSRRLDEERIEPSRAVAAAAVDPAAGCRFVSRCPIAVGICSQITPALVEARPGQSARCHVTAPAPEVVAVISR
jgi:oligopeptide/dipeptide ABC transporter ATP-binding protein